VNYVQIFAFAAQNRQRDKVIALDAGAEDYIVKLLAMQESLALIRAVLRRNSAQGKHQIFISKDLTIECDQRTVCVAGKETRLTPEEHEELRLLIENQGKTLRDHRLHEAMWGSEYGSQSEDLRVSVCQLRKKVEVNPRYSKLICTDPWFGDHFAPPRAN
jgi:two-component system KDP operon response regulator KdpE